MNLDGTGLVYSTMFGGNDSGNTRGTGIAIDSAGNAWISGQTDGGALPVTGGAFQPTHGGATFEGFVTKFNPTGTALLFSSYLGGNGEDFGLGIASDEAGDVYVTGQTSSTNFLTTVGAYDVTNNASADAFVTKISAAGTPVFSTYLGGTQTDSGLAITVDSEGQPFVSGHAELNFPSTDLGYGGAVDGFAAMLSRSGADLAWSTYLGGDQFDEARGIDLGPTGSTYVAGVAASADFPTTIGVVQPTRNGGARDAFVTKLICPGDQDCDSFLDPAPVAHQGPANTNPAVDNCLSIWNPEQLNADGNFVDLTPPRPNDDLTWINSDALGDECDPDDDNDLMADVLEPAGCNGSGPLNPTERDTDLDRYLDPVECALGTNPADASSKPASSTVCGPSVDLDDDGVRDHVEYCFYGSDPTANGDGDLCSDGKEVATVDTNSVVNSTDLGIVASAFGAYTAPPAPGTAWRMNMDVDKNGTVNSADLGLVAAQFGSCI
jgi:hypothetical protein